MRFAIRDQQKGDEMESKIQWETEIDAALRKARSEKKPVVVDFFNPG